MLNTQRQNLGWPGEIFRSEIKQNVRLAETAAFYTNIFDYRDTFNKKDFKQLSKWESANSAAEQYKELALEIIEKLNG